MPNVIRVVQRVISGTHARVYQLSGGRIGGALAGLPVLLLTTMGRKSGRSNTRPLIYLRDGEEYLVSAANNGFDWQPGWLFNLHEQAVATIQIGNVVRSVKATIALGDDRARLYELFKAASANFVQYEKGTARAIAVVRLEPTS